MSDFSFSKKLYILPPKTHSSNVGAEVLSPPFLIRFIAKCELKTFHYIAQLW